MVDLFAALTNQPIWISIAIMALLYLSVFGCTVLIVRPAIVSFLDPLNIKLSIFLVPALSGFILVPLLTGFYSESYFVILLFLAAWLLVIRAAGKPKKNDLRDRMGTDFQVILLFLAASITIANVIVNMIIPGKIPLLTAGGVYSRFDATENSRLLTWISFGTSPMAGAIYALTQNVRVRKIAVLAVILQAIESLLFASKSGILTVVFILLNAWFIAKTRKEEKRSKSIRKIFLYVTAVVALLSPVYLEIIGVGTNVTAIGAIVIRFLGGFDQLILAAHYNLLAHADFGSIIHSNLIEYQLMPFFKSVFDVKYEYSNIGQYVLEAAWGISIDGPYTFPNSNLILEAVLTSGKYLGFIYYLFELSCFYWCRRVALRRPVTPWSLVLVLGTIFDPAGLFSSGQEWVVEMILKFIVVVIAVMLSMMWSGIKWTIRQRSTLPYLEGSTG